MISEAIQPGTTALQEAHNWYKTQSFPGLLHGCCLIRYSSYFLPFSLFQTHNGICLWDQNSGRRQIGTQEDWQKTVLRLPICLYQFYSVKWRHVTCWVPGVLERVQVYLSGLSESAFAKWQKYVNLWYVKNALIYSETQMRIVIWFKCLYSWQFISKFWACF